MEVYEVPVLEEVVLAADQMSESPDADNSLGYDEIA